MPCGHTRSATIRSYVRYIVEYPLFLFGLIAFGLGCLLWSLIASVLYRLLPAEQGRWIGQTGITRGFRGYLTVMEALGLFRCDLQALDSLRDAGPMVIAPNHPSLLDIVVVSSRLPKVVCITKAALWDNVFLGGSVRLAGYIRNDSPLRLVKQGVLSLKSGQQLLVFPEGTRTEYGVVGELRGGFLLMARRAEMPVQTVFLEYESGFLGKRWPLFRKPPLPVVIKARLGRRFMVPAGIQDCLADLATEYQESLKPLDA
jgi:1-acyl-sn-glycerol-3-phosphate acyltransferase